MAALERISSEREREKIAFCRDNNVATRFHDQIAYSYKYDLTIEVYLKGSDVPFEGIVYQIDDNSFVLVENSGKISRIYAVEIQALRWQSNVPAEEKSLYEQAQAGIVMNR